MAGAANATAHKAKPAIDQIAAMAHRAVDKATDAAAPAADWLAEQRESLNATQKKLVADTASYVSANPLKSIAIAVAAGFLLGRIDISWRILAGHCQKTGNSQRCCGSAGGTTTTVSPGL